MWLIMAKNKHETLCYSYYNFNIQLISRKRRMQIVNNEVSISYAKNVTFLSCELLMNLWYLQNTVGN